MIKMLAEMNNFVVECLKICYTLELNKYAGTAQNIITDLVQ